MKQSFFDDLQSKLHGWTPVLIATRKGYARIQLQSEPPQSEECGTIKCITRGTLVECIQACIDWCKEHPLS